MKLTDILVLEGLEIHEDNHNILEFGVIDFCSIENADDFSLGNYEVDYYEKNYDCSEITYSIYQDEKVIDSGLSEEDVREFLQTLEEKYKQFERETKTILEQREKKKNKSLLEQREEILKKEEEEKEKKQKERYLKAYKKYSKTMNDEEFKTFLREILIKKGIADIPTGCLCGKNGCIDANVLANYFEKEIKEFEKEGIYVRFTWKNITFSLYENRGHSSYSIVKNEESKKYETKWHTL